MSNPALPIRSTQLVVLALGTGVILFLAVALTIAPLASPLEGARPMTPLLVGVALVLFVAQFGVLRLLATRTTARIAARRDEALAELDRGHAPPELVTATILGAGAGEGVALLGVVTYLLEANFVALLPVALGLVALALRWPSVEAYREAVNAAGRASY